MKKNDYLLLTMLGAYSFLFFNQNAGINFLLFNITLIAVYLANNIDLLKNRKWRGAALFSLTSALGILITSSELSVFANCCFILLLSGVSFNPKTSYLFSLMFSVFSVLSGYVWMVLDAIKRNNSRQHTPAKKSYRLLAIAITALLCLIFLMIYKEANPLFAENTKWINLDFISVQWIMFTIGGIFVIYPLLYHKTIPLIENYENGLTEKAVSFNGAGERQTTENFAAAILFSVLNLMLLLLNYGDVSTLWFDRALPKGISHSDFVHNGVGMLILSILIATSIVLYLYRKNFEDLKNDKLTKMLIYFWVLQNILMLVSTCMRNQLYIHDFNLTYKRIGVFVWLALAFIGLTLLFVKVALSRSNWFLIKTNVATWFVVLAGSTLVDWDLTITRYNLNNKPLQEVDFYYLMDLSDTNIPELLEVARRTDFETINTKMKNFTSNRNRYYQRSFTDLLNTKVYRFAYMYNSDWRSFDLRETRIAQALKMN